MTIRLYTVEDKDAWDNYVVGMPDSNCYHQIGWKEVIEKSFGHATYYLLSEDSSHNINGILPIVQLKSLLFGNFMVSLPYFNYGGICAKDMPIGEELLSRAIQIAKDKGVKHLEMRHTHSMNERLPVRTTKVAMHLNLPTDPSDLWKSFPSKLRTQAQRPTKDGMSVSVGRETELDNFYQVFSSNMRDLGTPVYSKDFFRNILRVFPSSTWICTVCSKDSEPVASGFLVGFRETMEIPWASSLRSYNRYSPNMLLYWSALKLACETGHKLFDFGRSTPGEGTYKFKEQWGAKPLQLYWHYWLNNGGALPELNVQNPKYRVAINIWKRLPVRITNLIGPSIVRNIP